MHWLASTRAKQTQETAAAHDEMMTGMRKYLSYAITATTLRGATAAVLILLLIHETKSAHMQGVVSSRPAETCHPGGVSRDLTGRSAIISSKLRSISNSWGGSFVGTEN